MHIVLKRILPKILPPVIYRYIRRIWIDYKAIQRVKSSYKYDLKQYLSYSDILGVDNAQKLIAKIIREYHIIEKGLTMPETRLGFGKELLITLCKDCIEFIELYDKNEVQLLHAIGVILEYDLYHKDHNFILESELQFFIDKVWSLCKKVENTKQRVTSRDDYFRFTKSSFIEFSKSRSSVRNYSNVDVPLKKLNNAFEIAKTTPSVCNRQCWRTYVYKNNDRIINILNIQGGNRGFGHLTNKLIVITAEIGVFHGTGERNQAFIDGGMYAMNLLYALHSQNIACCILNCSNSVEKDLTLRSICGIKESEVFIAMITCGIPPEEFKIAVSKRYEVQHTTTIV